MKTSDLKNITENLLETFVLAGKKSLELRQLGLKTHIKTDGSPVTNGDLEVDKIIKEQIIKLTPNIKIVSEETVNLKKKDDLKSIPNHPKNFWLIDPIDGTRDYVNNGDEFTLNASLIINNKPAIGIINVPAKKRLFYSYGYNFAFEKDANKVKKLDSNKLKLNKKICAVTNSSTPSEEVLLVHKKYKVEKFTNMRSSYKFCVIAAGEFDLYAAKPRAFEWDIAAGHAIVEHAGGVVTTLDEKDFLYGKPEYKNLSLLVKCSKNLL